jgi:hypothetical protein
MKPRIHRLQIASKQYHISGTDSEVALAHVLGLTFIELQQLEFTIISYLVSLTDHGLDSEQESFEIFSSKTFGSLIREMEKNAHLKPLAMEMLTAKEKRDFFIHKFLFNRYGGELTSEEEYADLVAEAAELGRLFASTRTRFHDFVLQNAPIEMFAVKRDPLTGEFIVIESEFSKAKARPI